MEHIDFHFSFHHYFNFPFEIHDNLSKCLNLWQYRNLFRPKLGLLLFVTFITDSVIKSIGHDLWFNTKNSLFIYNEAPLAHKSIRNTISEITFPININFSKFDLHPTPRISICFSFINNSQNMNLFTRLNRTLFFKNCHISNPLNLLKKKKNCYKMGLDSVSQYNLTSSSFF